LPWIRYRILIIPLCLSQGQGTSLRQGSGGFFTRKKWAKKSPPLRQGCTLTPFRTKKGTLEKLEHVSSVIDIDVTKQYSK
jgi:hypothetical protein